MRLERARESSDFASPELKQRFEESPAGHKTQYYRVLDTGVEVAFVAIDRWPDWGPPHLVLHELWVQRESRRQGVGSAVLALVESAGRNEGLEFVWLNPDALDGTPGEAELRRWYQARGYREDPASPGDLIKHLHSRGVPLRRP